MKKINSAFTVFIFAVILAGCSEGGPVQISANDGPAMRASGLGDTYAWLESADAAAQNPEVHSVLLKTIDQELARRGFSKADSESAGFWVAYRVIRENKTDSSVSAHGETYPRGTLIVLLVDPDTRKTIWAASAMARLLSNASPDERERRVQECVHQMFARMPPR